MSYNTKVYVEQGGDTQVIAAGGSLELGASVTLSISGTNVIITGLPTSDPAVAGALYTATNVLTLSAG
jgi:hypothetical protein